LVSFDLFSYRDADKVLETKGILGEIKSILQGISKVEHSEIQERFRSRGWVIERPILPEATWKWDAYKNKVAVSIELSLIDAVHRDFLRAILAQRHQDLDVLVYVTSTFKEPKFQNVKRDTKIFSEILTVPIFLVGLT